MVTFAYIDMIIWRYDLIIFVTLFLTKVVVGGEEGTSKISVKDLEGEGFQVTRKYIFQFGGIAPFKGYAVFSCLLAFFCSVCGSVGKWISPTKLKTISTF